MAATRTVTTPIPARRSNEILAAVVAVTTGAAGRAWSALRDLADSAQLGPDPQTTTSRWSGGRI